MKVIDLTKAYQDCYLERGDLDAYHAIYPQLFSHYKTFWGAPTGEPVRLDDSELNTLRQIILDSLPDIEERLFRGGLDLSEIDLILMVGQNTANGHGLLIDGHGKSWLAVETFTTPLLANVFITHELVHSCHYQQNNAFYFTNKNQQQSPMRQLLTEGIATYLSKTVLKIDWATALWADYLENDKQRDWMRLCHDNLSGLAEHFLSAIRTNDCASMFIASDPDNIYKFRCGYYLGLAVIETIVSLKNLNAMQLLTFPRDKLEKQTEALLQNPSEIIKSL